MSLGSPAEIIPFKPLLECRRQLHRIAGAKGTVVRPVSTDVGIRPEATETSHDEYGASSCCPSAGITSEPDSAWMAQVRRNATDLCRRLSRGQE
jgi:hypothetical protein